MMSRPGKTANWTLELTGCSGGELCGVLTPNRLVAGCPPVYLYAGRRTLAQATLTPRSHGASDFALSVAIPAAALDEGLHVLALAFEGSTESLAEYPIAVGQTLAAEAEATIARLETELTLLRRAFLSEMADQPLKASERPVIVADAIEALIASGATRAVPARPWPRRNPKRRAAPKAKRSR